MDECRNVCMYIHPYPIRFHSTTRVAPTTSVGPSPIHPPTTTNTNTNTTSMRFARGRQIGECGLPGASFIVPPGRYGVGPKGRNVVSISFPKKRNNVIPGPQCSFSIVCVYNLVHGRRRLAGSEPFFWATHSNKSAAPIETRKMSNPRPPL